MKKSSNHKENSTKNKVSEKYLEDYDILQNGKNNAEEISKDSVTPMLKRDKTTSESSFSQEKYLDRSTVVDASNVLEPTTEILGDVNKSQSEKTVNDEKGVLSTSPELYFHGR